MKTYITMPLRYLAGRKLRTFLTTLAVVFGVTVVFAVNMLMPAMSGALSASEMGVTGQVDMTVTSVTGEPFSDAVLDKVARANGVAAAAPAFHRPITLTAESNTPPFSLVGLDPTRAETVRFYQITAGRFLSGDDTNAAVVSQQLAQAVGVSAGDTFKLPTPDGLVDLSVVGVFNSQSEEEVLVTLKTAQTLFAAPGSITAIDVAINAGAQRDAVKQALVQALGPDYNVGSVLANSDLAANIQLGLVLVNVFGFLTLFMGAFLIFNTFRTVVVERRRDIGMLRAVGATRGTITRLILVESAIQGVIGTVIGIGLGYLLGVGLTSALQSAMGAFMRVRFANVTVPPEAIVLSAVMGVGVTILAGLLPAINAGRVPVLAAIREEQVDVVQRRVSRGAMAGAVLLALGIVGLFTGNSGLILLGGLLILAALVMLAPVLLHPLARVLEPVTRWLFAREGLMAEGNLNRNPGRASVTVSATMIALAVIVALSSVITSLHAMFEGNLRKSLGADVLMLPPNLGVWRGNVGVGKEFEDQLAQIPGVGDWTGFSYAPGLVDGVGLQVLAIDPATYPKVSAIVFEEGGDNIYGELSAGRTAVANRIFATRFGYKLGDNVPLQTPQGVQTYRIVGIGTDYLGAKVNTLYISKPNMAADFGRTDDVMVMANLTRDADAAAVRANIEGLLKGYPQLTLHWGADWMAEQVATLNQLFSALYILLGALIIPSVLGLINTLAINVLERTREIGVLRAIGATQSQIRRLVVAEALLLGMVGTALGLLAGLVLGYALIIPLTGLFSSTTSYFFPVAGIIFATALALIMALLASVLPARQAARVKIVQALQYE